MKSFAVFATMTGLAILSAQPNQNAEVKKVPAANIRADSGTRMFKGYCAACHGLDGKGDGPAAPALKTKPSDLTTLKQKNGGEFPSMHVAQIIRGSNDIVAHGSSDMPLWGPIFLTMDSSHSVASLRITNLTKYIESIQK